MKNHNLFLLLNVIFQNQTIPFRIKNEIKNKIDKSCTVANDALFIF